MIAAPLPGSIVKPQSLELIRSGLPASAPG
jgi:hypothetical protein